MAYTKTTWANGTAPAINAANLQNIEDALADLNATAAARTILDIDADTVSGYGIGGFATALNNQDCNAVTTPGIYRLTGTPTNVPVTFDPDGAVLFVLGQNAFVTWQLFFAVNSSGTAFPGEMYFRCINQNHAGGWQTWGKVWNTVNAGNGDQPPAPKPLNATNTPGNWNYVASKLTGNGQTGGTYAVIGVDATGLVLGAYAGIAQGYDLSAIWATTASHMFYRTA